MTKSQSRGFDYSRHKPWPFWGAGKEWPPINPLPSPPLSELNVQPSPASTGVGKFCLPFTYSGTIATLTEANSPVTVLGMAATLFKVYATVVTAPTGADIQVKVYKDGSSQAGTISIAAGSKSGASAGLAKAFAKASELTMSVEQVGSTVAGVTLVVSCWFEELAA